MSRDLNVTVCQGVGDIFWVHQLLLPHCDSVRYEVLHVGCGEPDRQTRAAGFLKLLPKVAGVKHRVAKQKEYEALAGGAFDLKALLAKGGGPFAVNAHLEAGKRLEAVCPDLPVCETVSIHTEACYIPRRYVALYVSGSTMLDSVRRDVGVWGVGQWAELVRGFYDRYNLDLPLVIVGAHYDGEAMTAVGGLLHGRMPVHYQTDLRPAQVCCTLSRCEVFLGYQSGLSVLADQFDKRQLMMYFPHLDRMRGSWPKRANLAGGIHQSSTFDRTPQQVLEALPWEI